MFWGKRKWHMQNCIIPFYRFRLMQSSLVSNGIIFWYNQMTARQVAGKKELFKIIPHNQTDIDLSIQM